jgi:hypothetical protein
LSQSKQVRPDACGPEIHPGTLTRAVASLKSWNTSQTSSFA